MIQDTVTIKENLKYLQLLARDYPSIAEASSEIINLEAQLKLPKGTEHFMSDIHGEHEAFTHILNNASGVIKEKVDTVLGKTVPAAERASFATLIYYPAQKLRQIRNSGVDMMEWYRIALYRLIDVCRLVASKNTRRFVRQSLPEGFEYIIDELLHAHFEDHSKEMYYDRIVSAIIDTGRADAFIEALSELIKKLAVCKLHIVGDIFDRGKRPDIIMDMLMSHHAVDIQWGNHDVLWMGAASGSASCIANVINNSLSYDNLEALEDAYGINLRPLAQFADEIYKNSNVDNFMPKNIEDGAYDLKSMKRVARMHKAIAIILFKVECGIVNRNPDFDLEDRKLLEKIDFESGTVTINGKAYPVKDIDFPTVDPKNPSALTQEESQVIEKLRLNFMQSERLAIHIRFLYSKGSMYRIENGNLLFHGAVPLNDVGNFAKVTFDGVEYSGRRLMDYCERMARQGYFAAEGTPQRKRGQDFLWYLWCGKNSPLFGRSKMTTFEHLLVEDKTTWAEEKNPYYRCIDSEYVARFILTEFGLDPATSHIVNGHVPVRVADGEKPIKAGGHLIVIDGGFCKAYHKKTGIAGYTLVYSSRGLSLRSHEPFESVQCAIQQNKDIASTVDVFETMKKRLLIEDTDEGRAQMNDIRELEQLLAAYRLGLIKERK
ncbi:MAG: fructose-1,6-bisphosphatase [Oscillospiraceae bacterium]|nr:fructose-1,6-bisphosphatase [Oscillospiraceae bacterium]